MATIENLKLLWPEILLILAATYVYLGGAFSIARPDWRRSFWPSFALAAYGAGALALLYGQSWLFFDPEEVNLNPSMTLWLEPFGGWLRLLALVTGAALTMIFHRRLRGELASEHVGTLMLVTVGVMLACSANDLVLLFLALELVSVPSYVLLFVSGRSQASAEATMKYFFLSIVSSAVLLYGFSFLYGLGGSTSLLAIRNGLSVSAADAAWLAPLATTLIFAGLSFKLAAVPFHFYAPDVYQGGSSGVAALLAVAPKIAGFAALVRIMAVTLPFTNADYAWKLVAAVAIVTMTLGNVCALWQKEIRRLMAWSSVAHSGYMLVGVAAALAVGRLTAFGGISALLIYLITYALASLGTFACLSSLATADSEPDRIDELAGLIRSHPLVAGCLAVFMFSLAGLPPLAGFWGKLTLLTGAVDAASTKADDGVWFVVLGVAMVLNAAIGAAYYLRVISVACFYNPSERRAATWGMAPVAMTICAALVLLIGFAPGIALERASVAERALKIRPVLRQQTSAHLAE